MRGVRYDRAAMYVSRNTRRLARYHPFPARQNTRIAVACGRMALSKLRQPTSAVGPSWSQRASREARLAFRKAQRTGDRRGAMDIASTADARGLDQQAQIGTAEGRVAGQAAQREADAAAVAEMSDALTPPARTAAAKIGTAPAQPGTTPAKTGTAASQQRQELAGNATPPNPAPRTPVPGASQVPENPVSGASTPQTGDVVSRLANRRQSEQQPDFLSRVRSLTSADGENLTRKDAILRANEERVRSGKPPLDVDETIDNMLEQDRAPDRGKQIGSALNRGPIGSPDPTLARTFRGAGPLRQPARPIAEPPTAQPPPPAAAPTSRTAPPLPSRQPGTPRPYGNQFREEDVMTIGQLTEPIRKLGRPLGAFIERRAQENRTSAARYLNDARARNSLRSQQP